MRTLAVVGLVVALYVPASAQMGGGPGMMGGHGGMMGGGGMMCPMCGGTGRMPTAWNGQIPEKLPKPKSALWVSRLREILALEKLSQAQYTADEAKYDVRMPYMMIIPQEQNHIAWINRLFRAYGITPDVKTPPLRKSQSVRQAYEIGRSIEGQSIPKYVWLVKNANDEKTRQVLDTILVQTRMHQMMFTHALEMGGMGVMGGMR